ncbi:cTAGE family member 5 isoform X2 [Pungitius pungitius]|uniref:cTAGE family member 5 isoform X2 n=1 Tax=Pungitius pungitius TaxID=134920 RepID=UPI002E12DA1B
MAFSQTCKILWVTGMVFVILPHFSLGLLSDYKICGDTECESLLSRAQATRDHRGKDCRFLSFRRGEIIFVYQKLTGKREDLWAGSINKQFGYFPKEAVQEEQVYATLEKVVETQKSDFFCIDESGYLIDSSHLDDDADNDQKSQVSETTQRATFSRDTSAESTSTSPVSVEDTPAKEEESKSAGDAASRTDEGARETPAAPGDQGGSAPSSSWLGSSVTGWLGLAEEDEAGSLAEGGKTEETTENGADASAASSVTEWLRLGGERKPDDVLKSREANTENADSFTATMTGWLGFGGETKTVEKGQDDEREDDKEQAERFRSRRMSLDLEGSQLHEEEKKESGTLGWLGSGLSSTLRFGLTTQDSELKSTPEREAIETDQEEEEQLAPGSWFDVGIKGMLGFGEDKREVDESAESGLKETEENKTFEHLTDSENLDISQSQRALTGEVGTETSNESKVGETTQDQNVQSEIRVHAENNDVGSSDTKKHVSTEDAATMVDLKDVSPQTDLEKPFQTEGGLSLMLKSSKEKEEDNVSENLKTEKPTELRLIENKAEAEGNNREAGGDDSKTARGNDQDVYTLSGTNFGSDSSSLVLNLNSEGQSVDNFEDITGDAVEEGDENPIPTADDRAEQRRVRGASGGEIRPSLSSGAVEESHEPVSNEDGPLLAHSVGDNGDSLDSLAVIDSPETETLLGDTGEAGETREGSSQQFGLLRSTNKSKDISYENALEEDRRKLSTNESATQIENTSAVRESVSPHLPQQAIQSVGDEHKLEKTIPETQGEKKRQPVQSETIESEIYNLNESGLKSAIFSRKETQTEKVRSKEEEKEESEELKGEGKQQKVKEIKEYDKEKEGQKIKEEEKKEEAKESKEEKKQEEGEKIEEEEEQQEARETEEEKNQEEGEKIEEEEEEEEQKEAREAEDEKKQGEGMKIEDEEKQKEEEKTMEEETQDEVKETKEEKKQEEEKMIKEEEEEEEQKEAREAEDEKKQGEGMKIEDEEKQKEEKKTMKEETQDEVKETKEEKKQGEEKMIKEEEEEEEQKEAREAEEEKNPEEGKKIEEEEKQKEGKRIMEEEKLTVMEDLKEQKSWAEKDNLNGEGEKGEMGEREKKQEVSRRAEEQGDVKELKPEGKQQEIEEFKEEREVEDIEEQARDKEKVMAEIREEEVEEMENMEEEGIVKCSKELCSEASKDGSVQDRDENDSANVLNSLKEGRVATGQQNPVADNDQTLADRTGASQPVPVEGVENDEDVIKVKKEKDENKDDGAMADEEKNNDLPHSGESTKPLSLGQTTQNTEYDQRLSSEAHNTELQYTETISNGVSAEKKTEQVLSDHKIVTEVHTDREENAKHGDSRTDGVEEVPVLSEESSPSDGHNVGTSRETPSGGAFGLFKSTISFFGSPVTKTEGPNESTPSLGSNTGEPTDEQAPPPPEQEVDTTHDSNQVNGQHLHSDSPVTVSLPRPCPPLAEARRSPPSPTQTPSHPVESPLQTKTPNKHNKSLLGHMSAEEATILTDLFGRHKLQFLDYTLGGAGTEANHPDGDDAILLDIERLLGHYREALVAPSIGLADAPLEDMEKTRTLIALQKLETLLARVRETFSTARDSSVRESYPTHSKTPAEEVPPGSLDRNAPRDEWIGEDKDKDGSLSGNTAKPRLTGDERRVEEGERRESERRPSEPRPPIQPASPHPPKGVIRQIVEFAHQIASYMHAARELLIWLTSQFVSSLPDDIRPGPDLYGLSWEPVIVSSLVGLVTMLLFTCRCYSSVKSRMYRSKERRMAEQVALLLDEKCKVLEDLSKCQQEYDGLESTLKETGVLAQTQKTEHLEVKARQLGHAKRELDRDLEQLKDQLDRQREQRIEQERKIALLEETIKTSEEETRDLLSQDEQAQTTLKVYSMNSNRLQEKLETAGEEKALLQESNAQLRQEVEGWAERVSELEAEMSRCEVAHGAMLQDVATKDERIMSLTDRLLGMKAWDSDMEEGEGEAEGQKETSNGRAEANGKAEVKGTQGHLQKVQKLIYAAKLNADLKAVDEDKDRLFAKLNDEVKAKEELQESIREMDNEKLSLQSDSEQYQDQVQRLQQKLQIMTEMYQENELKLHRLLTVEEKERLQKEEKLNKADKNIALAMEELSNYRQRAAEMEEELEKTKQSYQTQISAHEKKAHNNWLAARAAERDLADIRRENSLFRQKLTDTQFKLDALDKDPYALDSLARPLPFRGGQGEQDQSGGPHSDSGSSSPTWERDRRGPPPGPSGPLGPPGYMFPESGGPMYRRPPVGPLGPLHHPGPLHPRGLPPVPPHPADMADGSFKDGPGDLEHRESGPGDRRTPPEADPRIGGAPPPGHPMGPVGGPFLRRGPYGPPPPDFYPTRGPPGPPMMPMWAPPPPGMMLPPRFPPGGPNAPRPYYAPTMRPPLLDGHPHPSMGPLPPQQAASSLSHSQSPEEHTPPPEDVI